MKRKQFCFSVLKCSAKLHEGKFVLYFQTIKMKETILSNCERNFVLRAAQELKRLDGRNLREFRPLRVHFGEDWGFCYVSLGETKVLTQVTCEIQEPKTTRPNEGLLFINVELSSMAAPHFEPGRASDLSIHLNRLLEKCIKDSKAVDLESLCIVAEEKVWALRVDVNVLNHEGSLVDCASISALAALAHFKRPDVTTDGEKIVVHKVSERDPIPIVLHHYPVCVSFALLNNSENIFVDPTATEERVSDACLTFGINAYKEICCLHLGGIALTKPKIILTCSTRAADRSKEVVEIIKEELRNDAEARNLKKQTGFVSSFEWDKITAMSEGALKVRLSKFIIKGFDSSAMEAKVHPDHCNENFVVVNLGENCAELTTSSNFSSENNNSDDICPPPRKFLKKSIGNELSDKVVESFGEGGSSKWEVELKILNPSTDSDSCSDQEKEICEIPHEPKQVESIELSGDSEEEEVVILSSNNISDPQSTRGKPTRKNKVEARGNNAKTRMQNRSSSKQKRNHRRKGKKVKT